MKLPISKRLLLCADLVPPCDTVADVGTDHGFLGIHLLQTGRCRRVLAADLREKPLASARANAAAFAVADRMDFVRSDGLHNLDNNAFDVLVMAGMGGDLIAHILAEAPWLEAGDKTLILQPQSAANDLRRFLGERRYAIEVESLVRDGRFLYTVMRVLPGISPGTDSRTHSGGSRRAAFSLGIPGGALFGRTSSFLSGHSLSDSMNSPLLYTKPEGL